MSTSWVSAIQAILDGENVDAATTNRAILQVAQRTQYLYDLLKAATAGQALISKSVPVATTVEVGDIVYYNKSTSKYAEGLAAVSGDVDTGPWYAADSAEIVGMVLSKDANNIADLFIGGSLNIVPYLTAAGKTLNSLLDSASGTFGTGGNFYASAVDAGKLSKSRGVVSAFVGSIDATGKLNINPVTIGSNRDHVHYAISLVPDEAATSADQGWLEANTTNFPSADFTIPVGAVYGYNIEHADEETLRAIFPPAPINFYYIEKDGVGLDTATVVVNGTNIWWMNSTADPWDVGAVPVPTIKLWITKLDQLGSIGQVISAEPKTDDATRLPIDVFVDGEAATGPASGVVKLAAQAFTSDPTASEAATALKGLAGKVRTFGPVLNRITPGAGIVIVSSNGNKNDGFFGNCQILLEDAISLFGDSEVAVLNGSREDANNGLHYLVLPKSKNTSIRFKLKLGSNSGGTKIRFFLRLYAPAGGNIPTIGLSYRQIAAPGVGVAGVVGLTDTTATDYTAQSAITLAANGHVLVQSPQLPASGNAATGDIFFLEISRDGVTDGYTHDVGILEAYYKFE